MTMLELQKIVLRGVKENRKLFKKELEKSLQWLTTNEVNQLYKWLVNNFSDSHHNVIEEVFHKECDVVM